MSLTTELKGDHMGKYLIIGTYTAEGARGLLGEGGSGRREAVDALAASMDGKVESFYFAFGSEDAFVVVDLPSDEAAAAVALTVGSGGSVAVRTIPLLTPEQVDAAAKMSPAYRPPGG